MKAKNFEKKLVLNKKTISHLESSELDGVRGGWTRNTCYYTCLPCDTALQTCLCPVFQTEYETCDPGWC
jgi:hypothetical protein